MVKRIVGAGGILLILASLPGCSSSRLSVFPDFPRHKEQLGRSVILADFLLMQASHSDTPSVDVAANKTTADKILGYAEGQLSRKGYNVASRVLTSTGLLLDDASVANVSRTSSLDPEEGGRSIYLHPPFYLYQALRRDTVLKGLLETVYMKLVRTGDDPALLPVVEEIIPLGQALGGGMIFIVLGGGYEIPAGVAVTRDLAQPEGSSTFIKHRQVTQSSLHLYVLNSETGEIIWTDHQIRQGGVNYDDKYLMMAENLFEDFP